MNPRLTLPLLALLALTACQGQADAPAGLATPDNPPAKLGLCSSCHGSAGRAVLAGYPHLAGQDALYLRSAMQAYRAGTREHSQMQAIAGVLSESDIAELSDWYSRQTPTPAVAP